MLTLLTIVLVVEGIIAVDAIAQTSPPFRAGLTLDKSTYNSGEKIQVVLSLGNYSGGDKIAPWGFKAMRFDFYLVFTDPDGKVITSNLLRDKPLTDSPPPHRFQTQTGDLVQVEAVETIPVTWRLSVTIPNVRDYYTFSKPGKYYVKAIIPFRTYKQIDFGGSPDYSQLDHLDLEGHIESASGVSFTLLGPKTASGTINIKAEKYTVGIGSHPFLTKEPINGMLVQVFDMSDSCIARIKKSKYGCTWYNYKSIWDNCRVVASSGVTDQNNTGRVSFPLPPGDYLIIGLYDPDKIPNSGNELYIGVTANDLDPKETMDRYLWIIATADGKQAPCQYTTKAGSRLQIIEPEYIQWDGSHALYPFVLEGDGIWAVTTSISPSVGLVADRNSLTEEVISEAKAVQFSITDVGNKGGDTKVEHRIKHKGKTEIVGSKVGMKLSEKLAKQKGLSIFGVQ